MRLVFFGSGTFGLAGLSALLATAEEVVLAVTQPPRRRRRGGKPEPTDVHRKASCAQIPVLTPKDVNATAALDALQAAKADLFAVADYGQILSPELLAIPRLGCLNMHASLLPRHRGASPVVAAILAGDKQTGVSIQRVVMRVDAGPVLAGDRIAIGPDENAGELSARLAPLGGSLLAEVVRAFARGRPPPGRDQDEAQATFCRRLSRDDAVVDWTQDAEQVARHVRAMTPKPGAHTRWGELGLVLVRACAAGGEAEPGVVAALSAQGFEVGCGTGRLRVLELVPASRRLMSARDFCHGYGLRAGERFG